MGRKIKKIKKKNWPRQKSLGTLPAGAASGLKKAGPRPGNWGGSKKGVKKISIFNHTQKRAG